MSGARIVALERRVAELEAALAARPLRKRIASPRPSDATIAARERLWARYVLLFLQHGRGRVTRLSFAVRNHLNPGEFSRFFSSTDRRGIPEGSSVAQRFYSALHAAIAELEARSRVKVISTAEITSHGNVVSSQFPAGRVH